MVCMKGVYDKACFIMVRGMLNIFKKAIEKKNIIYAPVKGTLRELSEIEDDTFRSQTLGKTVAIDPLDNTIYSPVSGVVTGLFPTCQSINIRSDNGHDILLHIGLNTHMLNGTGFFTHIHKGDHVKAGQRILEIDREMMLGNHYDPVILLILTNSAKFQKITLKAKTEVVLMEELLETEALK